MAPIAHKKQIGMYTFTLSENGTLQIQAPTLLKPVIVDARQTQELARWLAELHQFAPTTTDATPAAAPAVQPQEVAPTAPTSTATVQTPAPEIPDTSQETPETTARRVIRATISAIDAQNPEMLSPENRDRLIEQVTRHAALRQLLSQNKISRKQIMIWVDQDAG